MASSRPSPTFLMRAARWPGPWTAVLGSAQPGRPRHLRRHERLVRAARIQDSGRAVGPPVALRRRHGTPFPEDIMEEDQGPRIPVLQVYRVQAHSLIILRV